MDTDTLAGVLYERQKVIYGVDNRKDIFEINDAALLKDADCVVALFEKCGVRDNGDGTSTLQTQQFGTRQSTCAAASPSASSRGCVLQRLPGRARRGGHRRPLRGPAEPLDRHPLRVRLQDGRAPPSLPGRSRTARSTAAGRLLGRQLTQRSLDWAVVRLDRRVTGHRPAPVRRRRRVGQGAKVHVIGHPVGLPAKVAGGAIVRDNTPSPFFVANLDTYGGNSGSPVFNSRTHRVEGILVRGERDFVSRGNCTVSFVCPTTGCRGEDVTRITKLVNLIPPAP